MIVHLLLYERDDGPIPKQELVDVESVPRIGERVFWRDRRFAVKQVHWVIDNIERRTAVKTTTPHVHCELDE